MNKKKFYLAFTSVTALLLTGIVISQSSNSNFLIGKEVYASDNWFHYAAYDGGCTEYSTKEYWTNCQGTTVTSNPGGTIAEERTVSKEDVETIISKYGKKDERLFIGHNLSNDLCTKCHQYAITSKVFDTYTGDGTKGTAKLEIDTTYESDWFVNMYKYTHTYNDGTSKFAISNVFNETSLEGISKIQFKIVVPEFRFLIAGDDTTNYEIYASKDSSTLNPVSTIISINRVGETDNWVMTDSNKIIRNYGGDVVDSASLSNRKTFKELIHNFTNWGVSYAYFSDIMTNKHICEFDTVNGLCSCGCQVATSFTIADPSTLTVDTKYNAPSSMGNVKMYKRSGYGSNLFAGLSLADLSEIRFYIVNEDSGNGFVLNTINKWTDYQGVIPGGSAPQTVIAKKSGIDWVVTTESGINLGAAGTLASTAGPSYTISNPSTIKDIMNTLSGSTTIYVSDIIVKSSSEVITNEAIATGEVGGKTYTLTKTSTVYGLGNLYSYSCSSYFRAMFTDIAIDSYNLIKFYYDGSASNDQITFKYGDSYFGFHKGAGNVTGLMEAINLGGGSWKLNTFGGLLMRLSDASKVSELTLTGCTKLNELFSVTADGWANTPISISDILASK